MDDIVFILGTTHNCVYFSQRKICLMGLEKKRANHSGNFYRQSIQFMLLLFLQAACFLGLIPKFTFVFCNFWRWQIRMPGSTAMPLAGIQTLLLRWLLLLETIAALSSRYSNMKTKSCTDFSVWRERNVWGSVEPAVKVLLLEYQWDRRKCPY